MSKEDYSTIRILTKHLIEIKRAIPGTGYTIGEFVTDASLEKIERDNLRNWIETPRQIGKLPHDPSKVIGTIESIEPDGDGYKLTAIVNPTKPDGE